VTAAPLLSVRDLRVGFPGSAADAVRGIDFDVAAGEIRALVGESGSGKSVTALSVLDLLPPWTGARVSGSIRFGDEQLVGLGPAAMRRLRGNRIAMIFQEPMTSLNPIQPIGRQVAEAVRIHTDIGRQAALARALELLDRVGIRDATRRLEAHPHELSGGERQRVMIAMALANDPDLLIADEPTTALDVTVQAQILDLLHEMRRRLGMAVLLITHDLAIVRRVADRVAVMQQGEIVETAPVAELFDTPRHPYTRMLLAAEPKGPPPVPTGDGAEVLTARDLRVDFPVRSGILRRVTGRAVVVDGVALRLREGETLGVVGESGSGKTTLAMALLRLVPSTGAIAFRGQALDATDARTMKALRRDMQIVFQDPYGALSPRMSVGDIVGEGLKVHRIATAAERTDLVAAALSEVGLDPALRHRYPHEFSGGQRQRIAIARAMVLRPKLVILDEPTSALDRSIQAQIVDLLRDLQARHGMAYVFISHDLRVVRAIATHVLVMRAGKVVEQGPAEAIFDRPVAAYTKALLAAAG
jgi:microcin C transport system ATP-binding protein